MTFRCLIIFAISFTPLWMAAGTASPGKITSNGEPATSSVLANGKWYKIKIQQTGIYRLTYEDLVGMGFSNPGEVSLFGNGGKMLPLINGVPHPDDLVENAVFMSTGADGTFNQGDYILFYGEGPVTWKFDPGTGMFLHTIHQYSNASYYFVTTDAGQKLRISAREALTAIPDVEIRSFVDYSFHERNRYNFLESGRQWFGDRVDYTPFDSVFIFSNLVTEAPVKVRLNVAGRAAGDRIFTLAHDNAQIGSIGVLKVNLKNKTGAYATQSQGVFSFRSNDDQINLKLTFNKSGSEDEGYLDYMTLNARRRLILTGDALFFRDTTATGRDMTAGYFIENCTQQTEVWDITDPFEVKRIPAQLTGSVLSFTDSTRTLHEYVVLKAGAAFLKPVTEDDTDIGIVPNQDLHSMGSNRMLIVTHPDFIAAADSIAAYHRQKDNFNVAVVTTAQIYNEFSSGAPDISAIRDFARMIYNRDTSDSDRLGYLLLVGDGSYNNLSKSEGNSNYILTYQSENSLNASFSYVSDDFFGMMEDGEGGSNFMEDFTLDLGVGRLPVKTSEEALDLYRKIKSYNHADAKGDWQNNILFAGDDEDGNLHMNQANELANWVDDTYPEFAVKKVFIDAYPQVASSTGTRYPEANRIITNNLEKGLLIFNYTGHGGEIGLADEQILMREDLIGLKNKAHLPLFITATCEFSRFDDLARSEDGTLTESTSAGEYSILNPDGGSIALVTTTRIVYSSENHELNSRFLQIALSKDQNGRYRPLGDVVRMAKNVLGESRNKLNFILLGDPALRLAIAEHTVETDSVNHISVTAPLDTLRAFSKITVSGHIEDNNHNLMTSFNGVIYPSVYDKKKTVTTLANDGGSFPMQFTTREDLLYKGKASVIGGRFTFEFIIPKDITYNYGNGRIIYYSQDPDSDAKGEFSDFIIGGTDRSAEPDFEGPLISLYLNDEYFNDAGITNPNPVIYAQISDESGINTIGNGIGHDITGVIDDDVANPIVMNDYFETLQDDFTSGTLTYPMQDLEEGIHSLRVKVWDVYNNSAEASIEFRVIPGDRIIISKAGNYPNPAYDHTTFVFEHNKADEELIVTISVFDLGGRLLFNFTDPVNTTGFNSSSPVWDLRDLNGNLLKQGVYPYRIRITDSKGSSADSYRKLVVIR